MDPDSATKGAGNTAAAANTSGNSLGALASPPMERNNSQSSSASTHKPSHVAAHRQSFVENQRHPPPSPRNHRHPSLTQQALLELMNHPPSNRLPNPRYAGRDWRDIAVGELTVSEDVRWADVDLSVQDATMLLLKHNPTNVVLIRETPTSKTAVSTFDYSDLNAYLLVVVGLAKPEEEQVDLYADISRKAQSQEHISLKEIQSLSRKEELVTFPAEATLDGAMEAFSSGIHRILVTNHAGEVVGVLTQLHLVEFFWHEAAHFPVIERLYGCLLRDLQIGSHQIIAINLDRPLTDALLLMHNEGLTSVAVVDQGLNVVGNISTADVKHLTNATSLPLLKNSCMNFISVILSERGMEHGRDSFPVFHVNPYSTLGHTVGKLVATRSHRMWVVESASPSPSAPATPPLQPSFPAGPGPAPTHSGSGGVGSPPPSSTVIIPLPANASAPQSPLPNQSFSTTVIPTGLPGAILSGRLTGVVSMTDILNLFAKSSGLRPSDPSEQRARRRRSSSCSVRPSLDSARASVDFNARR
ncbi:hypothetical protein N657DRAFT_377601 [Parathielavia appendiculata]|uniref:Protein SDS23 n=1 Tax=Parathielavia appendiculata TaxID=2587402 RepID=A0AAN6U1J8_9PEZI|nr:hypothetical protein N657DRAFT_377601 [Parathielavia appendiculata]